MKRTRCFLGAFDPSGGFYRNFFRFFGEWKLNVTMLMNASRPLFEYHSEPGTRFVQGFQFDRCLRSILKARQKLLQRMPQGFLSTTP